MAIYQSVNKALQETRVADFLIVNAPGMKKKAGELKCIASWCAINFINITIKQFVPIFFDPILYQKINKLKSFLPSCHE